MKSYDQSHNKSNLIRKILYLLKVDLLLVICYMTYLTFFINFSNQSFKLICTINFLNQPIIELKALLACDKLLLLIYIYKRVYSYLLSYI